PRPSDRAREDRARDLSQEIRDRAAGDRPLPEGGDARLPAERARVFRAPRADQSLSPPDGVPRVARRPAGEGRPLEPQPQGARRRRARLATPPPRPGLALADPALGRSDVPDRPDPEAPVGAPDPHARPRRGSLPVLTRASARGLAPSSRCAAASSVAAWKTSGSGGQ